MSPSLRKKLLHRVADAIEDRADDSPCSMHRQAGHRFMAKAAIRAAENFRSFADKCADGPRRPNMPSDEHWISERVPIGPVGVITPWNTPFHAVDLEDCAGVGGWLHGVHKPAE